MRDRGRSRGVVVGVLGIVAVVAVAVAAVLVLRDGGDDGPEAAGADEAGARRAAEAFAAAVEAGRPGGGGTEQSPDEVDAEWLVAVEGLGPVTVTVAVGAVEAGVEAATAALTTEWDVGGTTWSTLGELALRRAPEEPTDEGADGDRTWQARWELAALDARLRPDDRLSAERTQPERGAVLDGAGASLVQRTPVVRVGVEPRRVTDLPALTAELALLLDIDGEALSGRVEAAAEDAFVEVITLREEDYLPLRDRLQPLPGTVFVREEQDLARSRDFALPVLGRVVAASEEAIAASDGRLRPGDVTGQGGIQEAYDERLGGESGLEIRVTRAAPLEPEVPSTSVTEAPPGEADPVVEVLEEVPAVDGADVATTLDGRVQEAAEAALEGEERLTSLVAVRISSSEVLAIANRNGGSFDYGSRAEVPPGSTFKVVTTLALLRQGLTPDQVVPCPATAEVDGRSFKNAGDFALGDVPFRTVFARSCNTAFVNLSPQLGPDELTEAGSAFGLGGDWGIGIPSYSGSVPATEGPVDTAASSIGQGRLLASPLAMAGVAATVAAGRWKAPSLVVDPPVGDVPAEVLLGPGEAETLQDLMAAVVAEGSGDALQGVPGGPVGAKTGTAEFGTEDPPRAHAWIIGYQGDVAFAVFVEGGEAGGGVAGPLAARFLTLLAD